MFWSKGRSDSTLALFKMTSFSVSPETHPISSLWSSPVGSPDRIHLEPKHLSPCPMLPHWARPPCPSRGFLLLPPNCSSCLPAFSSYSHTPPSSQRMVFHKLKIRSCFSSASNFPVASTTIYNKIQSLPHSLRGFCNLGLPLTLIQVHWPPWHPHHAQLIPDLAPLWLLSSLHRVVPPQKSNVPSSSLLETSQISLS